MSDNTESLSSRVLPTRRAAAQATSRFGGQLGSSPPSSDAEGEAKSKPISEPLKRKGSIKSRYGGKPKSSKAPTSRGASTKSQLNSKASVSQLPSAPGPSHNGGTASAPIPRPTSKRKRRHRSYSESFDSDQDDSDLTSLSSSKPASTRERAAPKSSRAIRAKSPHLFESMKLPSSAAARAAKPLSVTDTWKKRRTQNNWSTALPDPFVWLLVDSGGRPIDDEYMDDSDSSDFQGMWWPGRITGDDKDTTPLQVWLFGKFSRTVEIRSLSSSNMLSLFTSRDAPRFDSSDFVCFRPAEAIDASPRKKRKVDFVGEWKDAVEELIRIETWENDNLCNTAWSGWSDVYDELTAGEKGEERETDDDELSDLGGPETEDDRWSPPPCDAQLDIPGELVFCRDKSNMRRTIFWPAKLVSYIPPTNRKEKPRYGIEYVDGTEVKAPRNWFYTSDDRDFCTCKLGEYESVVNNAYDRFEEPEEEDRAPSPTPTLPVPDDFADQSIHAQLSYAKPVLLAVLRNTYGPAKSKHNRFMKGGGNREALTKSAGAQGTFSPGEADELLYYLTRWVMREDRFAKRSSRKVADPVELAPDDRGVNDKNETLVEAVNTEATSSDVEFPSSPVEMPPSSFIEPELRPSSSSVVRESDQSSNADNIENSGYTGTDPHANAGSDDIPPSDLQGTQDGRLRPLRGSSDYETLSNVERIKYCGDVLLPEAIIQLMLWRQGERTSLALLDPDEEQRLHDVGQKLALDRDWVLDLMRLRDAQTRVQHVSAPAAEAKAPVVIGGTRSRPRTATAPTSTRG